MFDLHVVTPGPKRVASPNAVAAAEWRLARNRLLQADVLRQERPVAAGSRTNRDDDLARSEIAAREHRHYMAAGRSHGTQERLRSGRLGTCRNNHRGAGCGEGAAD
jgi:hypothetical protein